MRSRLYVNELGQLMCGQPDKKTSIVTGVKREYINIDNPEEFDYYLVFKNSLGVKCHGYTFTCIMKYWMYNEYQGQ